MQEEDKKLAELIFQNHYDYYKNVGIETIKQQAGQVEQVSADYQGRVIFELLQNAFDKAEENILVKIHDNSLYIANDGNKFTYQSDYDYITGNSSRGDFQSLCSMSTSNKSVNENIGNKGVGFKSVYSISKDGFVNIYTKGMVVNSDNSYFESKICFSIYDSFKDKENLPIQLSDELIAIIKNKISNAQIERKDRGLPGYYFPILLENNNQFIENLFQKGFVTIVEIPYSNFESELKPLIEEIKKIHFYFVKLKYNKNIKIHFEIGEDHFQKSIYCDTNERIISIPLNENAQLIAKAAGIQIEHPKVAVHIKRLDSNDNGLLYNYLPTKYLSPFKYVDFHADFHTTVDRKDINFEGKIGEYNKALFTACIELYFILLSTYIEFENKRLKINYINLDALNLDSIILFDWKFIQLGNTSWWWLYGVVRNILNINDYSYTNCSFIFAGIAKKYFSERRKESEHDDFFINTIKFIEFFGRYSGQSYDLTKEFKKILSKQLRTVDAQIIPSTTSLNTISITNELFFREDISQTKSVEIPSFLNLDIVKYNITDNDFKKSLGIKDFTDYNEILKYYRQVSYSGQYLQEKILESQQIELLKSLAGIYKNKRDTIISSTHRYFRMYTVQDRENNSTANQAYFSICSVFLKTNLGKYKPAQLCKKNDLDLIFLNELNLGNDLDVFLKFIGVSLDTNYIYSDIRVYNSLKDGLDFIPRPQLKDEFSEKLSGDNILPNVSIINVKGKFIHPSIVNDNNYHFLENISGRNIVPELDCLLVKKYDKFPEEYLIILFKTIEPLHYGVDRIYLKLFYSFHKYLNKYLVSLQGKLFWKLKSDTFYIVQNRQEYEVLKKYDIPILCYFISTDIPDELANKKITLKDDDAIFEGQIEVTNEIIELLNSKMVFILTAISNSLYSELNFKEDSSRIKEIQRQLSSCQIFKCDKLSRKIVCIEAKKEFSSSTDIWINRETNQIYYKKNCSKRAQAELFARFFFGNISVVSEIELILLKDESDLELDFPKEDINFYKRIWVNDYEKQFKKFNILILDSIENFKDQYDPKWYIYDKTHKSKILVWLSESRKLDEIETIIQKIKLNFNGLFDDFKLEIDYGMNDLQIIKMKSFLIPIQDKTSKNYISELEQLSKLIGQEKRLNEIELQLIEMYKYNNDENDIIGNENEKDKLDFERKISTILEKISKINTVSTSNFNATGNPENKNINVNKKKLIFQGTNELLKLNDEDSLEITGASGEEQVLGFYIIKFLKLPIELRQKAIHEIYDALKIKLGNDSHLIFKDKCLEVVNDNEKLKAALIPFLYISLSHKFSYFDLIVYKDNKPTIVEVKTTQNNNNNSFYMSISEINEARSEVNYEIVRVTPSEILFMGNPIRELNSKITSIEGGNYKLIPRNYKFEFSK